MTPRDTSARAITAVAIILAILVGVVPLTVTPGAFGPFHAGKWFLVLVMVPLGLAASVLSGSLRWPRRNVFLAWAGVCLVAALLGPAPLMSILGSPNRNAGFVAVLVSIGAFIIAASVGHEPRVQRTVLRAAFISGGIVGLLAIAQRLGLDIGQGDDEITRTGSTWGSPTFAGAHMVLVLPIAIAHLRSRDNLWRTVAAIATASMTIGLLLTGTRGAWVAAIVAAAIVWPVWRHHQQASAAEPAGVESELPRPQSGLVFKLVIGVVLLIVVAAFMIPNLGRSSGAGRIDLWRTTVNVVVDQPIIGSGPDTQRVVLPSGIDDAFEQEHGSDELHDRAHNLVLDTAVTTGLVGVVVFGLLLVLIGRDIHQSLRRQLTPTAIAAGLVAYLTTLLFAFGDPILDPIAWILAGLVLASASPVTDEDKAVQPSRLRLVGVAACLLVAILAVAWAGNEVVAEYDVNRAFGHRDAGESTEALESFHRGADRARARFDIDQMAVRYVTELLMTGAPIQGLNSENNGDGAGRTLVDDAFDRLDRAERIAGDDPDLLMDRAELLTALDRNDEALAVYERVMELYPNSFRAHLGRGVSAAQVNDLELAQSSWQRAAHLGPHDARAEVNLGILYERQGDPDAALAAFQRALDISPDEAAAQAGVERVTLPMSD